MTPSNFVEFSWIFNVFDFRMEISLSLNWEFLMGLSEGFMGFLMLFSWQFPMKTPESAPWKTC